MRVIIRSGKIHLTAKSMINWTIQNSLYGPYFVQAFQNEMAD